MDRKNSSLIEPTLELKVEFLRMAEEYRAADDDRYNAALENFSAFLRRLETYANALDLPADYVPMTTFWMVCDKHIIGCARLRHSLTPDLEQEGGNIGYDIRPSERQKGYGTQILVLMLERARDLGLKRARLTCDSDNVASARIIEKNGGRFAGQGISSETRKLVSQYWIEL